jgi:hypothetical protein
LAEIVRRADPAKRNRSGGRRSFLTVMKCERPGVAVYPGLNTLTRMSRPLRSTIQVRANERTAAFDALYTEQAVNPLIDTIERVRITEEPLVKVAAPSAR